MGSAIAVGELRCEYALNPLGLDAPQPRLSWTLESERRGERQTAYQILVSGSRDALERDQGDAWDTGKVESEASTATYAGRPMRSGERLYWKVRAWDAQGAASEYSAVYWWEAGLLRREDWEGRWIGGGQLLRSVAALNKPVASARAYVAGLGYYELRINGSKVGDAVLSPAWTDYEKRILYDCYDVTEHLHVGTNAIGLILGKGRYPPSAEGDDGTRAGYGPPKAILQLNVRFEDGSTESFSTGGGNWRAASGPIVEDDLFGGETYDATREREGWDTPSYDESAFSNCSLVEPPGGVLRSSSGFPPIRVVGSIKPREVRLNAEGNCVYDFGQNFSGWVKLKVKGPRGTKVTMRFAEILNSDGSINTKTNERAAATDRYVLRGGGGLEQYEPRFTYHGFRYVELSGYPGTPPLDALEGRVVHTAVEPAGGFLCSHPIINRIHQNTLWAQKSNFMSIPTDCPQRNERMGWLGDAYLSAEEAMCNFWMVGFYEKWLRDVRETQTPDGSVSGVAPPYWNRNPADPPWGMAYVMIPYEVYVRYGDIGVLEEHYEPIKKYLGYLSSKAEGDLLPVNNYGDWCAPGHTRSPETPGELISTWSYYTVAQTMSKVARALGRSDDAKSFSRLADKIREAFNTKYLKRRWDRGGDYNKYSYGDTQIANALPLSAGLVPAANAGEVLESLLLHVVHHSDYHPYTGIIGTKFLFPVLAELGQEDVAFRAATQLTYPSFGYQIREGATTLWERWEYLGTDVLSSHNHVMFGSIDAYFYRYLAGIAVDEASPGFAHFTIKPLPPAGLESASASTRTPKGLVSASWKRKKHSFSLQARVPVSARATVFVPKLGLEKPQLSEGGTLIFQDGAAKPKESLPSGIEKIEEREAFLVCEVGSGSYDFTLVGAQ